VGTELAELLERWNSGEGKPYKGSLIDWSAYEADPANIGCMCAQGQVLHLLAGWSPEKLREHGSGRGGQGNRQAPQHLHSTFDPVAQRQ
jgi:hypothetical protein